VSTYIFDVHNTTRIGPYYSPSVYVVAVCCCSVLLQCLCDVSMYIFDVHNTTRIGSCCSPSVYDVAVCCCSVLLQCVVAVCCCSVLLQCVVAMRCCGVLLQCVVAVCCCSVLLQCVVAARCCSACKMNQCTYSTFTICGGYGQQDLQNYRSLLHNIVSFIGLFCKKDLQSNRSY